uniref:Sodium-dependent multivitamin transporter n=1 Tax=Strigamia maritima TaxID=126957 RepID=T1JMD2_STRMM
MANLTSLQTLDYIIVAVVAVLFLGIGFYFACLGGKQRTTREYFKGDGNMNVIPIVRLSYDFIIVYLISIMLYIFEVMSIMASFISSNAMLGIPAEVYYYGFNYFWITLGTFIGGPIAIYGFMPVFHKLAFTSIYEYVECRFNRTLRVSVGLMYIFSMIVHASFFIYAPALALSLMTGLTIWTSVLSTTIIGTIYTSIGGIKAVVWTDALQLIIFTGALLAPIINSGTSVGSFSYIFSKNMEGHRLANLSFDADPRVRFTFWGLIIYSIMNSLNLYGTNQTSIQRYLCCRNKITAQRTIWISLLGSFLITAVCCLIGLILYAMYWNCDPLASHQIQKHDQLFPLFVMQTMSSIPGMLGLFVAGVFCAALSSISSVLNSLTAVTLEDHVKPRWKSLSDEKATLLSKFTAVAYSILCLLVIAAIMNLGSIVQTVQYMIGGTMGASLGLFVLGFMNPWANAKGTFLGIVCGLAMGWWISFGNQIYRPPPNSLLPISTLNCSEILGDWRLRPNHNHTAFEFLLKIITDILEIYKISYVWIIPIACTVTVIIGSVGSLLIAKIDKGSVKNVDMKLLSPFVHSVMKKCFPNKHKELELKYKREISKELTNFQQSVKADEKLFECRDQV